MEGGYPEKHFDTKLQRDMRYLKMKVKPVRFFTTQIFSYSKYFEFVKNAGRRIEVPISQG